MIGTCRFEILGECLRARRRRLLAKMVVIVVTMMAVLTIRTDWTH